MVSRPRGSNAARPSAWKRLTILSDHAQRSLCRRSQSPEAHRHILRGERDCRGPPLDVNSPFRLASRTTRALDTKMGGYSRLGPAPIRTLSSIPRSRRGAAGPSYQAKRRPGFRPVNKTKMRAGLKLVGRFPVRISRNKTLLFFAPTRTDSDFRLSFRKLENLIFIIHTAAATRGPGLCGRYK